MSEVQKLIKNKLDSRTTWKLRNWLQENHEKFVQNKCSLEQIATMASQEFETTVTISNIRNNFKIIGLKVPIDATRKTSVKKEIISLKRDVEDLKKIVVNLCRRLDEKIPEEFISEN